MIDPKALPTLALQLAVDIYKEEMRLAVAYVGITSQPDSLIHAREHFKRADAAHFIVGLLFDAAEAQAELPAAEAATPIHVAEGSSHLPAPDPEAALVLNTLAPEALASAGEVEGSEGPLRAFSDDPTAVPLG